MKNNHSYALAIAFRAPDIDGVVDELLTSIRHISKYWDASQAERALFKLLCDSPARYGSTFYFSVSADLEPEDAQRFAELVEARAQSMDQKKFILDKADVSPIQCDYAFGGPKVTVAAALAEFPSTWDRLSTRISSTELAPAPAG